LVLCVVENYNESLAEQDGTAVICWKERRSNLDWFTGYPDQFLHDFPQFVNVNTRPRLEICNDRQQSRYSD
jgi:hypothetical protein